MFFIGDIHGKLDEYFDKLDIFGPHKSIQVGDFGFGFGKVTPDSWDINHKFIRGNHDDPVACRQHPNHLGKYMDYGVTEDGIFFVAGAYSVDVKWRLSVQHKYPYPIWWKEEEIAEKHFETIIKLYEKTKPKIVVSHDCPSEIRSTLIGDELPFRNRTSDGILSAMFKAHKPELWVFGHYHESYDGIVDGTRFKGLEELEIFEYNIEENK